jgi:cobalt-zinc-cadmium efflux system protein
MESAMAEREKPMQRLSNKRERRDHEITCTHGSDDGHGRAGHDHGHGGAGHAHGATDGPLLWISLVVTVAFVVGEFIAGRMANSLALVSDAGHNLSDAVALGLAAYAVWIAKKPANARKTYGYHRVGILTALFNAVTLVVIAILILVEAYHLFRAPEKVNGTLMLWVAGIAAIMNTVIALLLRGGAKESMNMRAAFIHMAGDALSSLGVVIAGLIVRGTGWLYADPVVSVLIAAFIIYTSWGILRSATDVLLEGTPHGLDTDTMVSTMCGVAHVQAVHDLHTWSVADGMSCLSCHVVVADTCSMSDCGSVLRSLNDLLGKEFGIAHATIQVENADMCESTAESSPLYCHESVVSPASQAGG